MSLHEALLNQTYYGFDIFVVFGFFITTGISMSVICRVNAMKPPKPWRITSEQILYICFGYWAMECWVDLVVYNFFSGYDLIIGAGVMLYLHSTYKDWIGDDCVSDSLNWWRKEYKERKKQMKSGVHYGRRSTDRRL